MEKQFNLRTEVTYDQWLAVKGSGNVGCGVIKQTGALLFEQIRIWNLKLPKYLKNSFKNEFDHWIIPNIDFRWLQCSIGTFNHSKVEPEGECYRKCHQDK